MSRTTCLALKRESHPINLEPTGTHLLVCAAGPSHTRPHSLARWLGRAGHQCIDARRRLRSDRSPATHLRLLEIKDTHRP